MATATLTRGTGFYYKDYNVQQASTTDDNWSFNVGHIATDLYNAKEYAAACYEFAVPTLTGSPHAMSITFSLTLTSHGSIRAVISTTPPISSGIITDWRNGPTSGVISESNSYTSSKSSITINVNDSASISGKTIYLYLYLPNDGYGGDIGNGYYTVSGIPTATLSYHIKHTLSISAGTGSTITVYRGTTTYGSKGNLKNGDTIYDSDKLTISASPNTNYRILTLTVNGSNFTSGSIHTVTGNVSVVSTAQILASDIGATDANIGANSTITVTKYNKNYYHEITVSFGGLGRRVSSDSGEWLYINQKGEVTTEETRFSATSISFRIPDGSEGYKLKDETTINFYNQIPNSKTGTCYVKCWTYSSASGGSVLGSAKETSFTVTAAKANCAPIVSGTVVDTNTKTAFLTGNTSTLIRYKSIAECTITATARNSASISSKTINGSTPTNNVITVSGDNLYNSKFVFSATDSRGYSTSVTKTPTMINYIKLTGNPSFYRPTPTSGMISLTFSGNYYNGSFGAYSNELAVGYRYREATESAFGNWVQLSNSNITISGNTYKSTSAITLSTYDGSTTGFDYKKSYVFEFWVGDGHEPWSASSSDDDKVLLTNIYLKGITVNAGVPVFDWGKDDFKFNVPAYLGDYRLSAIGYVDDSSARSDITIGSGNYIQVSPAENALPSDARLVAITMVTWTSNTGGFNIIPTGNSYGYIVGNSGVVIKGLKLRWWYVIN